MFYTFVFYASCKELLLYKPDEAPGSKCTVQALAQAGDSNLGVPLGAVWAQVTLTQFIEYMNRPRLKDMEICCVREAASHNSIPLTLHFRDWSQQTPICALMLPIISL